MGRVFDGRERFGRYLEEFRAGDLYKHWPGRTITEFDDTLFAQLTLNQHPLHSDAAYAEGTQHGQRLVVGTLVFSLAVGMSVADISGKAIANLEYESVKHLGPAWHGDTIYAETEVLEVRESESKPDRGVIYVETRAVNQRGEPVLSFRRRVLIPKRPPSPGSSLVPPIPGAGEIAEPSSGAEGAAHISLAQDWARDM